MKEKRRVKKTTIGLISKKATLHKKTNFFVHFFAVVLHGYNVKLPETYWLYVLCRKCRTCSCSFFSLPLIFTLVGATISYFPTAATKFSCCFSNKKMSPLFFISRWALLVCRLLSVVLCLSLLCFPNLWTWQSKLYTLDNTADTETISSLLTL